MAKDSRSDGRSLGQRRRSEGSRVQSAEENRSSASGWRNWNETYEGLGGRGWYEGWTDALHRLRGPFVGMGPRKYQRADSRIEEDINDRLTEHGMLDATDIEVNVNKGEVTLSGYVYDRQAKRLAEDIVDFVAGVKDVHNQIRIRRKPG